MTSFLDILGEAVARVQDGHPGVQFYEADGSEVHDLEPPVTSLVGAWRFVFNDGSTAPNSAVTLSWRDGTFDDPQHHDSPWVGDRVIRLPVAMDLSTAIYLMRKAGHQNPFTNVTLRYALYPGVTEPHYIFGTRPGPWVFVGVNTGRVMTESAD